MPASVEMFSEPDDFAAALKPSKVEVMPTGHGRCNFKLVSVELPATRLRRAIGSLPLLLHVQHPPEEAHIAFLPEETSAPVLVDGDVVDAAGLLCFGMGKTSNLRTIGPVRWAHLAMHRGELEALSSDIAEQVLVPAEARVANPSKSALHKLRALLAGTVELAINSPEVIAEPEVARSIDESLKETITDCLIGPEWQPHKSAKVRHATIMNRFRELLDANLDRALYLPEVCAALGISSRTLSYCSHEAFGMAPKRYFYSRRLHMARRALRDAYPSATTVTEVATRYGFWELGRFSMHYKAMFGEAPSATLGPVRKLSNRRLN